MTVWPTTTASRSAQSAQPAVTLTSRANWQLLIENIPAGDAAEVSQSGSVVDFGGFWTKDGHITINTGMADEFASAVLETLADLTARGDPVFNDEDEVLTGAGE